jgi:hypothetical protein
MKHGGKIFGSIQKVGYLRVVDLLVRHGSRANDDSVQCLSGSGLLVLRNHCQSP